VSGLYSAGGFPRELAELAGDFEQVAEHLGGKAEDSLHLVVTQSLVCAVGSEVADFTDVV
jgi:hypothetical protein